MTKPANTYADHRRRFLADLGDAVAVIPAGHEQPRNDDVDHEFRQDSDFYFLTGFPEPDAVVVLDADRFTLFVRPRDREMETWNGYRAGVQGAMERFGADDAYPIDDLESVLLDRLIGHSEMYYRWGGRLDGRMSELLKKLPSLHERFGYRVPFTITDPTSIVGELRLQKSEADLELLREACNVSAAGHLEAMRFSSPGRFEYQVQSAMEYVFRQHGSMRNGYPSIVASGTNATVLHYTENDRRMEDGDLVLIDAAAECGYFSADITRTFPVNGRFTGPQRAVYEVVLAAERAGIAAALPGATMRGIHETARRVIVEGLVELGLLPAGVDESITMHHYREFFMHGTGHWLGMDVHDAGTYMLDGEHRRLEPGMTFTVEPGLYVRSDQDVATFHLAEYDLDKWTERRLKLGLQKAKALEAEELDKAGSIEHPIPEEFRGIGVRIEDDILITTSGNENLTAAVPVDLEAVEAVCGEASRLPFLT
ncbi:MAG: aminopeptidase P N-terminal domain-containing protein [Acidimicrobiia bacterium]|nr:aminopeptidase P N-terminal domain-containing protein [Acidimicrobiia bacterium]